MKVWDLCDWQKKRRWTRVLLSFVILYLCINSALCNNNENKSNEENHINNFIQNETHVEKIRGLGREFWGFYIELVEPKARDGLDLSNLALPQCGGTKRGEVSFVASPDTHGFIKFHTKYSCGDIETSRYGYTGNGLCRIRFTKESTEDENSFDLLRPDSGLDNEDGWFNWGINMNIFEYVKFKFPNITCDKWTLQLQYMKDDIILYQWADVTLAIGQAISWEGLWMNGGSWINGKCYCPSGYGGKYCDGAGHFEAQGPSPWIISVFVVFVVSFLGIFTYIILKIINQKPPIKSKISPDNSAIDDIFDGTVFDSRTSISRDNQSFERRNKPTNQIFEADPEEEED